MNKQLNWYYKKKTVAIKTSSLDITFFKNLHNLFKINIRVNFVIKNQRHLVCWGQSTTYYKFLCGKKKSVC